MTASVVRLTLVGLIVGTLGWGAPSGADQREWKGAQTMAPAGLTPAPDRCGDPPVNVEMRLVGNGIDTAGGTFVALASICLNTETMEVFDLESTDTYTSSGDGISIIPGDFVLVVDPDTCVGTNAEPVPFTVTGGTGAFAGTGGGFYHFALNWPPCNGRAQPAHIWFDGTLDV